jgi:SPX domain protein involved in polyphosphate accumulation
MMQMGLEYQVKIPINSYSYLLGYIDYEKMKKLLQERERWDENSQFEVAPVLDHINNKTSAIVTFFIVKYYDTVRSTINVNY